MKKFFVPLFLFLLLGCSTEGFESTIAADAQKKGDCFVEATGICYKNISKNSCEEIGGISRVCAVEGDSSSSEDDESSSSVFVVLPSSSSEFVILPSSSSVPIVLPSSSSVPIVLPSSSSVFVVLPSSSSDLVVLPSSSSEFIIEPSSSSVLVVEPSSSSSSSLGQPDINVVTELCESFPYYVARTKKEYVKNLFSLEGNTTGCGSISYSPNSISNDSISFTIYSANSSIERSIDITASIKCGSKTYSAECSIKVVVAADSLKEVRCNHKDIFGPPLTPFKITKTTTIISYACCEPQKSDGYYVTCVKSYTLKIEGSPDISSTDNHANLPIFNPIPEPNAQCTPYGNSPGGVLYRYPKRILMTTSSSNVSGPNGGFTCESW